MALSSPDAARFASLVELKQARLTSTLILLDKTSEQHRVGRLIRREARIPAPAVGREVARLRSLRHQAIPPFVEHLETEEGNWFLFEHVLGTRLSMYGSDEQPLPFDWVAYWTVILLEALTCQHHLSPPRVLHGFTPADVVISKQGAFLTDPALLENLKPEMASLLRPNSYFIAPEQRVSIRRDGRADVYSVGAMAFWLLTGQRPPATFAGEVAAMDIPPEAARLIAAMVSTTPDGRPSSDEALSRMTPWFPNLENVAPPPPPRADEKGVAEETRRAPQPSAHEIPSWMERAPVEAPPPVPLQQEMVEEVAWALRRPAVAKPAAMLLLGLVVAGLFALSRLGHTAPPPAALLTLAEGRLQVQRPGETPEWQFDGRIDRPGRTAGTPGNSLHNTLLFGSGSQLRLSEETLWECQDCVDGVLRIRLFRGRLCVRLKGSDVVEVVINTAVARCADGGCLECELGTSQRFVQQHKGVTIVRYEGRELELRSGQRVSVEKGLPKATESVAPDAWEQWATGS